MSIVRNNISLFNSDADLVQVIKSHLPIWFYFNFWILHLILFLQRWSHSCGQAQPGRSRRKWASEQGKSLWIFVVFSLFPTQLSDVGHTCKSTLLFTSFFPGFGGSLSSFRRLVRRVIAWKKRTTSTCPSLPSVSSFECVWFLSNPCFLMR